MRLVANGLAVLVTLATLGALGPSAHAAGKSREQREAEARKACAKGQVDAGIEILADLLNEYGHPNYIYNQARCYQQNGRPEQAINRFKEYLRASADATPDERARVERFIRELETDLQASTPAVVPPPPAKVEPPVKAEAPVKAEPVAPIVLERPRPVRDRAVDTPPPAAPPLSGLDKATLVLGGVGVAGIVTGVVSSLRVRSLSDQVETLKVGQFDTNQLNAQNDKGHLFQTLQWVGYGVGGAALAGAIVCLIVDNGDRGAAEHAGGVRLLGALGPGGRPQLTIAGAF